MKRREFLQRLAGISALPFWAPAALSGCFSFYAEPGLASEEDERPILVVGAGMAGLAAAQALHQAGKSVIVLEGRKRIGGRTWTEKVGAATVDLGAAWIHGQRNNPLARLARENSIPFSEQTIWADAFFDAIGGGLLPRKVQNRTWATMAGFERALYSNSWNLGEEASYTDALLALLEDAELKEPMYRRARFQMEVLGSAMSAPLDDLSYQALFEEEEGEIRGGDQVLEGGYVRLVQVLARDLDIRTSTPVTRITHDEGGVQIQAGGQSIEAAHAVVTVPLGVLKKGSITFYPALPPAKRGAIRRIGFGSFEKVVLVFQERFWDETFSLGLSYLEGFGANRRFPFFVDMSEHAGAPTLACLYSGAFALRAQKDSSEDQRVAAALRVLETALGRKVPQPTATHATRWTTDPFSLGSYSYPAIGSSARDRQLLAEPIGSRLLFAGEATSALYPQTVHGAFLSGLREAERLVPSAWL